MPVAAFSASAEARIAGTLAVCVIAPFCELATMLLATVTAPRFRLPLAATFAASALLIVISASVLVGLFSTIRLPCPPLSALLCVP